MNGLNGHHRLILVIFKLTYEEVKASKCGVYIALDSEDGAIFKK